MSEQLTHPRAGRLELLRFAWSTMTRLQRRVSVGVAAILLVGAFGLVVDVAASYGRIHPGVSVDGIGLGRLTAAQAEERMIALAATLASEPAVGLADGRRFSVRPKEVGFALDPKATVDKAYRVGRKGPLSSVIGARFKGWFARLEVEPAVRTAGGALEKRIGSIAGVIDRAPADARIVDIDGHPAAVPAADGLELDQAAARRTLLKALATATRREVELPVVVTPPRIGTDAARGAAAQMDIAISKPFELVYGKRKWVVKAPVIRRWLEVTPQATTDRMDGPLTLVVTADRERVQATIDRITEPIVKPAVDARFAVDGDLVRIIPSKTGLAADSKAAYDLIARQIFSPTGPRTVSLGLHGVQPKLTTAGAKGLGIRQRISTYTTEYSSGNPQRVNNIHLLAQSLTNTLIAPGEEFSFNKTIGPRTAAKGYQEAPVIMNGKLVPALGGGICQVGTTIFNTVFFSGLPVTQRTNHSFYISHYPDGRDATVSWDGPDFRFNNDTPAWLLIKAFWGSDYVTISLYGTSPGYTVTYKTGSWRNQVAYPVRTIKDPTMFEGVKVVEDVGVAGHDVMVTRTVTKKGKVVRQDEFASYYRPKEQVVREGTKKRPLPPPPSKPATGTPDATPTGR